MPAGRPTKMTPDVVKKIEEAFLMGCSDAEACLFADISKQTLYNYQDKHPEFVDRKGILKENPVMLARQSVIRDLQSDGNLALKYLERAKKDEFSLRQELAHSGDINQLTEAQLDAKIAKLSGKVGVGGVAGGEEQESEAE